VGSSGSRDKIWYLQHSGLFEALREWDLRRLAEAATLHRYPRGQVILTGESDPELVYLVKEGRVKISTLSPEGKEQVLALLARGDLFGRLAPVDPRVPTRVEALEPSVICTIPPPVFEEIVRRVPEVGLRVIRVLAKRLRDAEQEIADLSLRSVPARLAALLLRLAEEYGTARDDGIQLPLRLTHRDLAHMVGSTRETVTAILSQWRDQGLVAVDQRTLVVRDVEGLRKAASPE
jgi:CRP/FNR family transcriptional regulator